MTKDVFNGDQDNKPAEKTVATGAGAGAGVAAKPPVPKAPGLHMQPPQPKPPFGMPVMQQPRHVAAPAKPAAPVATNIVVTDKTDKES